DLVGRGVVDDLDPREDEERDLLRGMAGELRRLLLVDEGHAALRAGAGRVVDHVVARKPAGWAYPVLRRRGGGRGAGSRHESDADREQNRKRESAKGAHGSLPVTGLVMRRRSSGGRGWLRAKRSRYCEGGMPRTLRNARRMDSGVPRPLSEQIVAR